MELEGLTWRLRRSSGACVGFHHRKESDAPEDRRQISQVFHLRLKKNMKLQTDPTVIYALGESFDGDIRRRDLRVDSPFNTYRYKGLPPTPIALPSGLLSTRR